MSATTHTEQTAVSTHVVAFSAIEKAVQEFEKRHKDVVHDCTTTAGDKAARKDRQEVQQHISSIEAKRVELKAPHLEAGREIDDIAKGYATRLVVLKSNYDKQIKAEEDRKAAAKRAAELEEQRKRDEAAAAERAAAAKREQELREQNERLQAELAAARAAAAPVQVAPIDDEPPHIVERAYTFAPTGWDRIEADEIPVATGARLDEAATIPAAPSRAPSVAAAHDSDLLDLLDAGSASASANMAVARDTRAVVPFKLPTTQQVADALSVHAKKRTNIRHVADVMEAIRTLIQD